MGDYSFNLTSGSDIYEPEIALQNGTVMFVSCIVGNNPGWNSHGVPITGPAFFGYNNVIVLGGAGGDFARVGYQTGLYQWFANTSTQGMQQDYAQRIDLKIDDGLPNSGIFGLISSYTNNPSSCTTGTNTYPATPGNCLVVAGKTIKSF